MYRESCTPRAIRRRLLASLYAIAHPDRVERAILDSSAPPMISLLAEMEQEVRRRMEKIYKPEEIERSYALRDPEMWVKAKDPIAICRELYYSVLRVYTYAQTFGEAIRVTSAWARSSRYGSSRRRVLTYGTARATLTCCQSLVS